MLTRIFIRNCLQRKFYTTYFKPFYSLQNSFISKIDISSKYLLNKQIPNLYTAKRLKHKKKSEEQNTIFEVEDDSDEDLSDLIEPHEKIINRTIPSLRLDVVVKSCLGIGRNKVDVAFLESKIRINGNKVLKKSIEVHEGDEIDVFVDRSRENAKCIIVHRLRIVSKSVLPNGFKVSLVRDKSLMIEDYK